MILQSTISPSPSPSPPPSQPPHSFPFPFPFGSFSFTPYSNNVSRPTTHQYNNISIKCSSISKVHNYGTMDFEKRPNLKWSSIYKTISLSNLDDKDVGVGEGVANILNQCENQGKTISKWELCRIVKELRKFRRFNLALQVYEWMNNRIERFKLSSSDTAIQLDLVAKVRGVPYAEDYFTRVPDTLKDKRIYGALLNTYVGEKMKDKAENLMEEMRNKGYTSHPLPYNVMMTLYMKFNEYDKVDELVSEMKLKSIQLDLYTYNIWLSARGSQGSPEPMVKVFEEMDSDPTIVANWTTFSTMAAMYVKMGQPEKAEQCLKNLETRITGRDRMAFHYLISLYGSIGKRDEVYRVWNIYKSVFPKIPNWGYHSGISALVRCGDMEGAEKLYEEWLPVRNSYDPKIGNLLMCWYVKDKPFEEIKSFFDQMIELGGKPNASSWEILGEAHIKEGRISEALDCFKESLSADGGKSWRPKPLNVNVFFELCDQEKREDIKEGLVGLLTQMGCWKDKGYRKLLTGFSDIEVENVENENEVKESNDYDPELLVSVIE